MGIKLFLTIVKRKIKTDLDQPVRNLFMLISESLIMEIIMLFLFLACAQENTAQDYSSSVIGISEQDQDGVSSETSEEEGYTAESDPETNEQDSSENPQDDRGDGELLNESGQVQEIDDELCMDAELHWEACTGIPIDFDNCADGVREEAVMVSQLTCDEIQNTIEFLPMCDSLGMNCDVDNACGAEGLTAADWNSILAATDLTTLNTIYDVEERIDLLEELFTDSGDVRGTFPTVYRPITELAVESIEGGVFEHQTWTESLVISFAARYLDNLRGHLLAQEVTDSWARYYDLSFDCSSSPLRVGSVGIVVHLVVDLPKTLAEIETTPEHADDFEAFGLSLVSATPEIIDELSWHYGVNAEPFFTGFFLGDWVDGAFGEDTMTTFVFQSIRQKAWTNGQFLQDWRWSIAEGDIWGFWHFADGVLATMDASDSI